jgi:peptidoglycan-associated lipoprotein
MNLVSRKLFFVIVSAAVLLTGCAKKPKRPDPSSTLLGPSTGGNIMPMDISTTADAGSLLTQRDGVIDDGHTIRGLLQPVYFDFDRFDIKQAERTKLEAAAQYLRDNPQHRLLLEGHCDWRGTAEYNLGLGDRRASSVKRYLQSIGVAPDRLETLSKGSLEALRNADDATMARDRRVNLIVVNPAMAAPRPL